MRNLRTYILFIIIPVLLGQFYKHFSRQAIESTALVLEGAPSTIIVGDSHTQTALKPDLIGRSINISISDENYFYTYAKLQVLLRHNKPDTVVLGYSWHNILKRTEKFLFDKSANSFFLDNYFILLDSPSIAVLADVNDNFIAAYLKYVCGIPAQIYTNELAFKQALGRKLQQHDFKFIGRYYGSYKSVVSNSSVEQRVNDLFFRMDEGRKYAGASPISSKYLFKIAELCSQYGIRLVLVNTPVHPRYLALLPVEAKNDFETLKNEVVRLYPSIKYIDLSGMPLHDSLYGDGDHVNAFGAVATSIETARQAGL